MAFVPHGVAVVHGMLFSSFAAEKLGYMSSEERATHDKICKLLTDRYPLPQPLPSVETVIKRAMKDNKRGMAMESDDEIADILLYKVGSIVPSDTHMLIRFPRTLVVEYLESAGFPHKEEDEAADALDGKADVAAEQCGEGPQSHQKHQRAYTNAAVVTANMESVSFVFGDRATVPGFLGSNVQDEILKHILDMNPDRVMVVTDSQVDEIHRDYFTALEGKPISGETGSASTGVKVHKMILPCGDACKAWIHLQDLVNWNFECGATRRSVVVAFGGGAIMNVTGLFASIVLRGMKLAYVPTTFLAMHDVVTSLKTSICHYGCKNNIGTFYAPDKILIDTAFCHSLPMGELFSGLGELTKNAALFGGEHREGLTAALSKEVADGEAFSLDSATLENLVRLGIKAKMDLLATDAYEKNYGIIFEYGHTIAHALEKAYGDGVVPHGVAVVHGMLFSSFAAEKLGYMSSEERATHDKICKLLTDRYPLPQPLPSVETVIKRAMKDNKRGMAMESDDEIADILLYKVGSIVPSDTHMLIRFPRTLVVEYLESAGFPHKEEDEAADALDGKADVAAEQCGEGPQSHQKHQRAYTNAAVVTANMESVSFVFGDRATVPGFLGSNVQDEILKHILDMNPDRVMVVTDSQVDEIHRDYFTALEGKPISGETGSANTGVKVHKMILPCGDACKAWIHLQDLVNWNFECGATRRSVCRCLWRRCHYECHRALRLHCPPGHEVGICTDHLLGHA